MPLGGFGLISLFYMALGVRFLFQFWPRRQAILDDDFTPYDRSMVSQGAFFLLLPISVLLHEAGHAVAILMFGGEIVDFGYYFFAGFVSYNPTGFSETQQWIVSFAGTFVNLVLIIIALWFALFKTPALNQAKSDLLIQFAFISGINAFVIYPLLDLASNLNGDWRQMYSSGVPALTLTIVAIQAAIIFVGFKLYRDPEWQAKVAARTGSVGNPFSNPSPSAPLNTKPGSTTATALSTPTMPVSVTNAIERVRSGWPERLDVLPIAGVPYPGLAIVWGSGSNRDGVVLAMPPDGSLAMFYANPGSGKSGPIKIWPDVPSEDDLTIALRKGLESAAAPPG